MQDFVHQKYDVEEYVAYIRKQMLSTLFNSLFVETPILRINHLVKWRICIAIVPLSNKHFPTIPAQAAEERRCADKVKDCGTWSLGSKILGS